MGQQNSVTIGVLNCGTSGTSVEIYNGGDTVMQTPKHDLWLEPGEGGTYDCKCADCHDCNYFYSPMTDEVSDGYTLIIGPNNKLIEVSGTSRTCENIKIMPWYNAWYYGNRMLNDEDNDFHEGQGENLVTIDQQDGATEQVQNSNAIVMDEQLIGSLRGLNFN